MKHTPGPWVLDVRGQPAPFGWAYDVEFPGRAAFARVHGANAKENAGLIAAAPDLLEAAMLALKEIGPLGPVVVQKKLRAAIRKAHG